MASDAMPAAAGVASRIRDVRMELGLNQAQFARELGVSRSHISEVENNSVKIPIDLLFAISDRFGQSTQNARIYRLVSGDDRPVPWDENPSSSPLNTVLSIDRRGLVAALKALDTSSLFVAPSSFDQRAAFFIQVLYAYMSELDRARQAGQQVEDARRIAEETCEKLFGGASSITAGDG